MSGSTKSVKARALRNALVSLRAETGLAQRPFAEKYGFEPGTWGRYESGKRTPNLATLNRIFEKLDVTTERRDEILSVAQGTNESRWLAVSLPGQRAQQAALIDFEMTATQITEVSPLLIPGLLQTSDYIRAIMSAAEVPTDELSTRVAVRIGRRDVITRHEPADLLVLLGEAALRQVIGDRDLMVRQLRYVTELAELPNVDLRVVPYRSGWHPALEGPFAVIESKEDPVVHLENRRSGLFLHEEEDVALYRQAADMVLEVAMSPAASTGLIADVIKDMETTT